ncbi:kappaPI-actitoxin-Avd3c-like [Lucilia sericata]|uniref:kappaPI-actitoxin-Avd3c-like n=1 Tax=Lucilia sericata TaxID=13632 RepID=UPI0018A8302C|nr:kappaPI-actitoxin-Avd3c-like [Lucilia sericata]
MKLLYILSFLLVALVTCCSAQNCRGTPANPSCVGGRNVGRGRGRRCRPQNVWYYDARTRRCQRMRYLGCRGNNNRWCNQAICEQRCRRP